MAITFLIIMVGKWNKKGLKAKTSKLFYIYLFTFPKFFLWLQNSFKCDGCILWRRAAELIRWSPWLASWHFAGMTVAVTKETHVEILQKIIPEDSPDISTFERVCVQCTCRMEHRHTHRRWQWSGWRIAFLRNWSRWTFTRTLTPMFIRSEPLTFLTLGLYERWNLEKNIPATISQMKNQVKEIIVSIPVEILQRVIGEFSRRIRNCIVARRILFEK